MEIFLLYLFLFLVGCLLGYGLEVLFRRFVTAKKWVNPGFMKGPWLPLYGFGLVLMFTIGTLFYRLMPSSCHLYNPSDMMGLGYSAGPSWYDLIPIFSIGIGMTLLELIAGLIFVKGFKVRLWDYTNMRGNFLGIICPQFSLIWFVCGVAFYYGVNPFLTRFASVAFNYMFGGNGEVAHFGFIFFMGVAYGIMLIDFISSAGVFSKISSFARQKGVVAHFDRLSEERNAMKLKAKEELESRLPRHLKESLEKPKEQPKFVQDIKAKIYIDPNAKKKPSDNYDEHGRPISEEGKSQDERK